MAERLPSSFVSKEAVQLPFVPLRDMVVFPHMMAPFIVGRAGSVRALERTLATDQKQIFLVAQRDPKVDDPGLEDVSEIGVIARVVQNIKLPNGNVKVMVEGVRRAKLLSLESELEDGEETGAYTAEIEAYTIDFPAG